MCYADKFFFCLHLEAGCLIVGFISFLLSTLLAVFSTILLCMEQSYPGCTEQYLEHYLHVIVNEETVNIILAATLLLAVLWMACSIMLVVGIRKNKPNFVLCYFSFGIMLVIIGMLSGLLLMLEGHWVMALVQFIFSMLYIHCLIVVHTTYDHMLMGILKFNQRTESDEAILVISAEEDNC